MAPARFSEEPGTDVVYLRDSAKTDAFCFSSSFKVLRTLAHLETIVKVLDFFLCKYGR